MKADTRYTSPLATTVSYGAGGRGSTSVSSGWVYVAGETLKDHILKGIHRLSDEDLEAVALAILDQYKIRDSMSDAVASLKF